MQSAAGHTQLFVSKRTFNTKMSSPENFSSKSMTVKNELFCVFVTEQKLTEKTKETVAAFRMTSPLYRQPTTANF